MTWNHVAFGTGEPNLKPFLSEAKGMGRNAFMMALSNVAVALAMNCFFPKWAVKVVVKNWELLDYFP